MPTSPFFRPSTRYPRSHLERATVDHNLSAVNGRPLSHPPGDLGLWQGTEAIPPDHDLQGLVRNSHDWGSQG